MHYDYQLPDGRIVPVAEIDQPMISYTLASGETVHAVRVTKEIARVAFQAADRAWSTELAKRFGAAAGDVRYTLRGQGEVGSDLAKAYLAFDAARVAWERSMGLTP